MRFRPKRTPVAKSVSHGGPTGNFRQLRLTVTKKPGADTFGFMRNFARDARYLAAVIAREPGWDNVAYAMAFFKRY